MTTDAPPEEAGGDGMPAPASAGFTETPEEIEFELRAAEGAIWTGGRILIGIVAFFFASLAFAYFYLRSANSEELWRPKGVTAPTGTGAAIAVVAVASAAMALYGASRLRRGSKLDWEVAGWTVVLGGLLVIGLQGWQLTTLPFWPGSSGYASCFIAWAIMNMVFVLSGVYWIETLLARAIRLRSAAREEGGTGSDLLLSRLFRANLEACSYYWGMIALVSLFFWLIFYVV
jgi:heme/copper-type cytochrome/quinol oxidase subunit 3